ncbi:MULTISPECIES: phage protein NinX family protein [Paraburkholderia]|uniref:phage protein NinX family protein n=1 Tax=Paraburkholderia TaxID=1822464 RepID=UPI00225A6BE2|nr:MULTISPECIES: phage protein NinX family protein [Paraburkholderia]MCX4156985.1 DUF2591 family protein [Paraburkholderia aspalathi]MDN7166389.1 DUF2591 domain-containing protein [Paraburkholderia sp. SECH2]MDQ6394875.1 DUF2591 domain-containing protein [Paraburkholderia aspalathi]
MFVDELKGPWLDYWVERAERRDDDPETSSVVQATRKFSSDYALARPIIDRHGIVIGTIHDAELGTKAIACVGTVTLGGVRADDDRYWLGDSELEAAMRCYVGVTFGPEVA